MAREFGQRPSAFVDDGLHPVAALSIDTHAYIVGAREIEDKARRDKQKALAKSLSRR